MMMTNAEKALFESIKPTELTAYLSGTGWQRERVLNDVIAVWRRAADDARISIPVRSDFADYSRRLLEILQSLSEIEQSDFSYVLNRVAQSWADILRIRVTPSPLDYGSIPLSTSVVLLESIRNLLSSSARSALQPRNAYSARPPAEASSYLRNARLGQTEIGSYIFTVISPVTPDLDNAQAEAQRPFARRVVEHLATGLIAARDAAEENMRTQSMEPFGHAVLSGVSANLCEAVVKIAQSSDDNAFEVGFTWSYRQAIEVANPPKQFVVPGRILPSLRAASDYLKELEPEPDFELRGFVYKLEDIGNEMHDLRVSIHGVVDEKERAVEALFRGEERRLALQAIEETIPISCIGTLDRRARPYRIYDVRNFRLLAGQQEVGIEQNNYEEGPWT